MTEKWTTQEKSNAESQPWRGQDGLDAGALGSGARREPFPDGNEKETAAAGLSAPALRWLLSSPGDTGKLLR